MCVCVRACLCAPSACSACARQDKEHALEHSTGWARWQRSRARVAAEPGTCKLLRSPAHSLPARRSPRVAACGAQLSPLARPLALRERSILSIRYRAQVTIAGGNFSSFQNIVIFPFFFSFPQLVRRPGIGSGGCGRDGAGQAGSGAGERTAPSHTSLRRLSRPAACARRSCGGRGEHLTRRYCAPLDPAALGLQHPRLRAVSSCRGASGRARPPAPAARAPRVLCVCGPLRSGRACGRVGERTARGACHLPSGVARGPPGAAASVWEVASCYGGAQSSCCVVRRGGQRGRTPPPLRQNHALWAGLLGVKTMRAPPRTRGACPARSALVWRALAS